MAHAVVAMPALRIGYEIKPKRFVKATSSSRKARRPVYS
jgi:hypothetical protein